MSPRLEGPDFAAPAKLNLFLHVTGRRPDGYHLLQGAFILVDRQDRVRLRVRDDGAIRRVVALAGVPEEEDLAVRAARLLQAESGTRLGADIEVEKRIPMGGGLGGGSSDAATVLMALDRLWNTGIGADDLRPLGARLGADVPFFLFGRTAWVEGIGEVLRPLEYPARWYVVLVPPTPVPTGEIFAAAELTRNTEALKIEDFSANPRDGRFRNDLQPVVVARYPEVGRHLEWLSGFGAARLTGSGGCVFAEFDAREQAESVLKSMPGSMQGFVARGLERHPLFGR
jgi:4-diphosphocytidyl-2-C-methyl-D-erythritol kinase